MALLAARWGDLGILKGVQDEQLFILQTRNAKRTAAAALKVAVDLVDEDLITESTALNRVDPEQISQLLHPQLDPDADKVVLAQGLNASPGAATGLPVIDPDEAAEKATTMSSSFTRSAKPSA